MTTPTRPTRAATQALAALPQRDVPAVVDWLTAADPVDLVVDRAAVLALLPPLPGAVAHAYLADGDVLRAAYAAAACRDPRALRDLAGSCTDAEVRRAVLTNPATPARALLALVTAGAGIRTGPDTPGDWVTAAAGAALTARVLLDPADVAARPDGAVLVGQAELAATATDPAVLAGMAVHPHPAVRACTARNPHTGPATVTRLAGDPDEAVLVEVVGRDLLPASAVHALAGRARAGLSGRLADLVCLHPSTSQHLATACLPWATLAGVQVAADRWPATIPDTPPAG